MIVRSITGYDYFSAGVAFFQIADGFGEFGQTVASVDDWFYFSGCKELLQDGQVLFV